ncbi:DUF4190 domain-containing protein [Amycolatopsis balhimycina DSM 5908]|uniref:DUF4190 domain-containing protein n=1 Tax=Amycolatopsis balhimycina DSM 5908 TaxID=1081091 RepID=A0A428WYR0_AMYBA|nr:DUF4190 domain-containing protein [Amycolatopsis balhimycina]RSM48189.1 DUF4190 domain-containing protein [Amycolatopsis balhimycina DSM 5908]
MSEVDSSRRANSTPGAAPPPTRNPFAVASLVLGILGIFGLSLLVAPILGVVALVQIPKRNQTGRGMAIAGIVLSVVWAAVLTGALIVSVGWSTGGGTAPTGQALQAGECYLKQDTDIAKASCTKPHDGQAFATFTLTPPTGASSDDELEQAAAAGCQVRSDEYFGAGVEPDSGEVVTFHPGGADWAAGKHTAVCAVQARGGQYLAPYRR